jgi:hypothetical protein
MRRTVGSCFYCGQPADTVDHLWPKSQGGRSFVNACRECNSLLGARCFDSPTEKFLFAKQLLRRRLRGDLSLPAWAEGDVAELGPGLRGHVRRAKARHQLALRRLSWVPVDYLDSLEERAILEATA